MVGVWDLSVSGVVYDLTDGSQVKINGRVTLTITKIDDVTVNIQYSGNGGDLGNKATYLNGTLLDGAAGNDTFSMWARNVYIQFNGQGNHVNGMGQGLAYDTEGNYLEVATIKMKKQSGLVVIKD
jgi:hypothetical protein